MSIEENKAVVRRWFEAAYQDDTAADTLVAPDYVGHFPPNPDLHGREAIKRFNRQALVAFPDLQITFDDLIAEGDRVVVRWTMRGTHLGELRGGIAPTGKSFAITGTSTSRVAGGQVAESWGNIDYLGLFLQLGLVTPLGPPAR
jgi:predicted ester cyclase